MLRKFSSSSSSTTLSAGQNIRLGRVGSLISNNTFCSNNNSNNNTHNAVLVSSQPVSSLRTAFAAASKAKSASGAWVTELDKFLKRRDEERKKVERLAEQPHLTKEEADKMRLVASLMLMDDEVLEVKRINSLSLERIQDHQRRSMQTSEEKGMYIEDAVNKQVLDAFSNTDYNKKRVTMHWMQARKMRYYFIGSKFAVTICLWGVIHYWYKSDPNLMWVDKPSRLYYPNIVMNDVGVNI